MKRTCKHTVFFLLAFFFVSCNVFQEVDRLPVISANVLPSTAGSVLISGQGSEDQQVELFAVANENWQFSNWSGDIESEENPLNIVLTENIQLVANFVLAENEYRVNFVLRQVENLSELSFGQISGATDGFDADTDLEAPPPPPDDVLYAWFEGVDRRLLYDFRNAFATANEWILNIQPGNTNVVNLSWEIEGETAIRTLIFTNSDGSMEIDMLENNSAGLSLDELREFRIIHSSLQ